MNANGKASKPVHWKRVMIHLPIAIGLWVAMIFLLLNKPEFIQRLSPAGSVIAMFGLPAFYLFVVMMLTKGRGNSERASHMFFVDKMARKQALDLLRKAQIGNITNWQLDDNWPQSTDRALKALEERLWLLYDDNSESALSISQLDPENSALVERCIAFLQTDLEYQWPDYPFRQTGLSYWKNLFLSAKEKDRRWKAFCASGNIEAWPYLRKQ